MHSLNLLFKGNNLINLPSLGGRGSWGGGLNPSHLHPDPPPSRGRVGS